MEPTKPSLAILYPGNCEPLKASFHGVALPLAAVMGAYNAAAWVRRRQSHLAINATIYIAAVFWEQRHVAHHLLPCLPSEAPGPVDVHVHAEEGPPTVKAA
jgi:hypothetical protein